MLLCHVHSIVITENAFIILTDVDDSGAAMVTYNLRFVFISPCCPSDRLTGMKRHKMRTGFCTEAVSSEC